MVKTQRLFAAFLVCVLAGSSLLAGCSKPKPADYEKAKEVVTAAARKAGNSMRDRIAGFDKERFRDSFNSTVEFLGDAWEENRDKKYLNKISKRIDGLQQKIAEKSAEREAAKAEDSSSEGSVSGGKVTADPQSAGTGAADALLADYFEDFSKEDLQELGIEDASKEEVREFVQKVLEKDKKSGLAKIAITAGPEICKVLQLLIQNGDLDESQLSAPADVVSVPGPSGSEAAESSSTGSTAGTGAADEAAAAPQGSVEGSVSTIISALCTSGKFGKNNKDASAETVGVLTVIAANTARYSYQLVRGEITQEQYTDLVTEDIVIAIASMGTGILAKSLLPMVPGAYYAGCMAGTMLASSFYDEGKDVVMTLTQKDGINILEPFKGKTSSLSGRPAAAAAGMREALSGLKGLDLSKIKDSKISIFLTD